MYLLIPVQWPSTFLCPGRQLQMYPPSVFSQVSFEALQLFNSTDSHSSMSVRKSKEGSFHQCCLDEISNTITKYQCIRTDKSCT